MIWANELGVFFILFYLKRLICASAQFKMPCPIDLKECFPISKGWAHKLFYSGKGVVVLYLYMLDKFGTTPSLPTDP